MKRKGILFAVLLYICCTLAACSQELNSEHISEEEADFPTIAVYTVESMQNVNSCVYYKQGQTPLVFSGEASRFFEKIYVSTQCGNCGEKNISTKLIDPKEIDFPNGDTVIYSDSDQCYNCYHEKDIQQFMWSIKITRVTERICSQCKKTESDVTFSSNTPTCDGCNYMSQGEGGEGKLTCSQCGADCTYRGLEEDGRCEDCYFGN